MYENVTMMFGVVVPQGADRVRTRSLIVAENTSSTNIAHALKLEEFLEICIRYFGLF
jgi:hypothetical protein